MEKLFNNIAYLADASRGETTDFHEDMSYITEEVGELAKDLIDGRLKHGKDEAVDIVIASLSLFYRLGGSYTELQKTMKRQLKKWEKTL